MEITQPVIMDAKHKINWFLSSRFKFLTSTFKRKTQKIHGILGKIGY